MTSDYELAQAHLDRAYGAAERLMRETRLEYVEVWRSHALRWATLAEEVCADVTCDGVAEVRAIVDAN